MTIQGAFSSRTFRTWLGCEVFTHTEGNTTHIELSVPIALELAPDPKKDAGINWETGNFNRITSVGLMTRMVKRLYNNV